MKRSGRARRRRRGRRASLPPDVVAKLRLTHYPDDFDPAGKAVEAVVEGRRYEVG